jgi:outer membrane protein assembly factor BamB
MTAASRCALGLALFVVVVASAAPVPSGKGGDWPQFLGPNRDLTAPDTGLARTWPKDGPPRLWLRDVGEGFAGPVVVGERLILLHRVGNEDVVESLDIATGKSQWKQTAPTAYSDSFGKGDGPRSTPCVVDDRVYTLAANGRLQCLDLATGKLLWHRELLKDYTVRPSFFGVGTSPLVEGGLVILNVGGRNGAGIVAFDQTTGKEVWKATDQDASYASPVAATLDGVRHLLFFTREGLVSLDPATGAVRFAKRWRSRMDASVNAASPLVADGEVFVTASYGTGALLVRARKDGFDEVWQGADKLSCHFGTPVVKDGFLYGLDGRQEQGTELRCVEWKTGKVRWKKEGFGAGSLILADGRLFLLDENGDLVQIEANPDAYREVARAKILNTPPCRAQPALAGGRLYARDANKLGCWDLRK